MCCTGVHEFDVVAQALGSQLGSYSAGIAELEHDIGITWNCITLKSIPSHVYTIHPHTHTHTAELGKSLFAGATGHTYTSSRQAFDLS